MPPPDSTACPCDSGKLFTSCCQPLLEGRQQAKTAEQLMRSRYSAFATGKVNYLVDTHRPSQGQADSTKQLQTSIDHCRWLELTVSHCKQGQAGDKTGIVEFTALFEENDQLHQLHEISQFIYQDDRWFYQQGEHPASNKPVSFSRNDPCPCKSGLKYKKCHGR